MSIEKTIIDFVSLKTGGLVRLDTSLAKGIINIVMGRKALEVCGAKIQRYSMMHENYETIVTITLSHAEVDELIKYSLDNDPVTECYRFELIQEGAFVGYVYTVNPQLHERLKTF